MIPDRLQYFLDYFLNFETCVQIWTLGPRIYHQNTTQKERCLFFLGFQHNYGWGWGDLILPKWLINDSWSIAILFGTFSERPKMWPNLDPRTPYLSPKYFKTNKKLWGHPSKIFSYLRIWNSENRGKPVYQAFANFRNFETWILKMFKVRNAEDLKLAN